ncbi:hypothetical protein CsSME_00008307 [Camellia sinensis var. sinensis]
MPTTYFTKPYQHNLSGATPKGKLELVSSATLYWWLTRRKAKPLYSPKIHTLYRALLQKEGGTSIKRHALLVANQKESRTSI